MECEENFVEAAPSHIQNMSFYGDDELPIAFRRPRGDELQRKAAPAETGAELGQCRVLPVREWII